MHGLDALDRVARSLARHFDADEIVVIGSQATLVYGSFERSLIESAGMSGLRRPPNWTCRAGPNP